MTTMHAMQITTWTRATGSTYGSLAADVSGMLGEHAADHDTEAIEREYRAAIAAALPDGAFLAGDGFFAPVGSEATAEAAAAAVESVDLWAIVERHAK